MTRGGVSGCGQTYLAAVVGKLWIRDQHAQKRLMDFALDQIIGGVGARDGEAVSDQRIQIKFAIGEKFEKSSHVARFGPAHVADGIVDAFLLIGCVIPAGSIGARDAKVEFLLVKKSSRDIHRDRSHSDDYGAIARHCSGKIYWVVAGRLRRDEDCVGTVAAGVLA